MNERPQQPKSHEEIPTINTHLAENGRPGIEEYKTLRADIIEALERSKNQWVRAMKSAVGYVDPSKWEFQPNQETDKKADELFEYLLRNGYEDLAYEYQSKYEARRQHDTVDTVRREIETKRRAQKERKQIGDIDLESAHEGLSFLDSSFRENFSEDDETQVSSLIEYLKKTNRLDLAQNIELLLYHKNGRLSPGVLKGLLQKNESELEKTNYRDLISPAKRAFIYIAPEYKGPFGDEEAADMLALGSIFNVYGDEGTKKYVGLLLKKYSEKRDIWLASLNPSRLVEETYDGGFNEETDSVAKDYALKLRENERDSTVQPGIAQKYFDTYKKRRTAWLQAHRT